MKNEELPQRVQRNRSDGQTWEEVYELPEEAKHYIARLIISRRRAFTRPAGAASW